MTDYQTLKISPKIILKALPSRGFALSDYQKTEIDNIWRYEQDARKSKVFNGQLFNFIEIQDDLILGEFVEYKYYLAQLRNPNFIELLNIRPVCISGITMAGNKVLIGKRSSHVTQYPNYYETVPSGGVNSNTMVNDTIDLNRQFEQELWEETGISVTEIKKIEIFALLFDPENNLYELCANIHVNYTSLQASLQTSDEYSEFNWLSKQELKTFLNLSQIVPLTNYLLKSLFKISF